MLFIPWIFFVLAIVVFIHELGHLLAALAVGLPLSSMTIGTGPLVWGRCFSGVWLRIRAIPLFGIVTTCWNSKRPWKNATLAAGGPLADVVGFIVTYALGLEYTSAVFLFHAAVNLVPVKTDDLESDGWKIKYWLKK